jgi:hypothetical protein
VADSTKLYTEKILKIVRDRFNTYTGSTPVTNTVNSPRDVGYALQKSIIDFALAHKNQNIDHDSLIVIAKNVEGNLLTGQVVGVLQASEADQLIDELHDLVAQR